jgi:O-antigen/teichoic acid export membrane protein
MIINKLKRILSGQFIRNIGWLTGAELLNRIFRLGSTVVLARMFSTQDYGILAIIFTVFDFANVFTLKGGIGAKIIQADEKDVEIICNTSYWLNWILCSLLFIIQCLAAFPVSIFYHNNQLILPICIIAITYLTIPLFIVQSAMIQRENRLSITALSNAVQSTLVNILTVSFALLGLGIWAVVLPIVLTSPVPIIISYMKHSWRPPQNFNIERWQEVIKFGKNMLGVEILSRVRGNIDYLIVGHFLGIEALGLYYFAFNAGFSISLNILTSFFSALFPHLCAVRHNYKEFKHRYMQSLKIITLVFAPIIILQAALAQFYVPVIFGPKWIPAIPILLMTCLSVIPNAYWWSFSVLLNSLDKTHITFYLDMIFTVLFTFAILVAVKSGVFWVAVAVLICRIVALPMFIPFLKKYLNKNLISITT